DEDTIRMVDAVKDISFKYATRSGITVAVQDLSVPTERQEILNEAQRRVDEIDRQYRRGLLTEEESYQRTIEQWTQAKDLVERAVREAMDPYGAMAMMALSGAGKGGFGPITQLAG